MSHWTILPLGSVEHPLAEAWEEHTYKRFSDWITDTASAIEALGNLNPTSSGFILLKEEPNEGNLSALVIPRSLDWQMHTMVTHLPALQRLKAEDEERFTELKNLGDRTVRRAVHDSLVREVNLFAATIADVPTRKFVRMSDAENQIIDGLLAVAEEKAPPYLSLLQLYVEDRLDLILGKDHPQLLDFRKLPAERQKAAQGNIVELLGWQTLYPDLAMV